MWNDIKARLDRLRALAALPAELPEAAALLASHPAADGFPAATDLTPTITVIKGLVAYFEVLTIAPEVRNFLKPISSTFFKLIYLFFRSQ